MAMRQRDRGLKLTAQDAQDHYMDPPYGYSMDVGPGDTSPHQHRPREHLCSSPLLYYRDRHRDQQGFSSVRNVCFVQGTEFALNASPSAQGMALGDVTNDGNVELVVGCIDGSLSVFKQSSSKPWLSASKLGTILCVQVVTVQPENVKRIVVLNAEGWCWLFSVAAQDAGQETLVEAGGLRRLPRNTSNMAFFHLAPPTADAPEAARCCHTHVVLGGLDRTVYLYKIVGGSGEGGDGGSSHRFDLLALYHVEYSVSSLAVRRTGPDTQVLVGLSNSSHVVLHVRPYGDGDAAAGTPGEVPRWYADQHPHMIARAGDWEASGVERVYIASSGEESASVRQDGRIAWREGADLGEMVLPGPSFMPLARGVVLLSMCTWGGDVYFVDSANHAVRFALNVPVRAFLQGEYTVAPNTTAPCIFCATFDGQITMFSDIEEELTAAHRGRLADAQASVLDLTPLPPLGDEAEHATPTPCLSDAQPPAAHDPRLARGWAKRVRCALYDVTPQDVAALEQYKAALEARLQASASPEQRSGGE
eukprot:TRINITY_DN23108_c0_g1_i1.p1 TRINITY_DN23108_c0_g1~~TRINITY_DN23108_c0_g1_i1.p1  ORF type:complete len:533 (+),score=173.77 TRINITY_DN23108_c0_g1_i1:64-1662(+)